MVLNHARMAHHGPVEGIYPAVFELLKRHWHIAKPVSQFRFSIALCEQQNLICFAEPDNSYLRRQSALNDVAARRDGDWRAHEIAGVNKIFHAAQTRGKRAVSGRAVRPVAQDDIDIKTGKFEDLFEKIC